MRNGPVRVDTALSDEARAAARCLDPRAFTVRTVAAPLAREGDLAAPLLEPSATVLEPALRKLP